MKTATCEECGGQCPAASRPRRFCGKSCEGKWRSRKFAGNKYRVGKKPTNAFEKGHKAWNKGVEGIHLSPASEFKPGHSKTHRDEVGAVRVRTDKGGKPRAFIKTAQPNTWVYRSVHVWISSGKTIPKGSVIHHVNRDTLDDRLENLQCLTRAEHLREHRDEHDSEKKSDSLKAAWEKRRVSA